MRKVGHQVRQAVGAMEEFKKTSVQRLERIELKGGGVDDVNELQLDQLDQKFADQVKRMDQVQMKVDLSITSLRFQPWVMGSRPSTTSVPLHMGPVP